MNLKRQIFMESQVYYTSLGNIWDLRGQIIHLFQGFPSGSTGKESACNAGDTGDIGLISGSGRSPDRENDNPISVFLPGKSHGQRSLVGYSPKGCKESDLSEVTEHEHNLHMLWPNMIIQKQRRLKITIQTKSILKPHVTT